MKCKRFSPLPLLSTPLLLSRSLGPSQYIHTRAGIYGRLCALFTRARLFPLRVGGKGGGRSENYNECRATIADKGSQGLRCAVGESRKAGPLSLRLFLIDAVYFASKFIGLCACENCQDLRV